MFHILYKFTVFLVCVCLTIPIVFNVKSEDNKYLTSIVDLPLLAGLREEIGAGVAFDKPGGRIVEALAKGVVLKSSVLSFYSKVLPSLGWDLLHSDITGSRWQRSSEILKIEIVLEGKVVIVRYSISPK